MRILLAVAFLLLTVSVRAQTPNDALDDTAWLQERLDDLSKTATTDRSPFAAGKYIISQKLKVGPVMGLKLSGAGGHERSQNPGWDNRRGCTIFDWHGEEDGTILELAGTSGLVMEGLNFRGKAAHGVLIRHGSGSLNMAIRDCGFAGMAVGLQCGSAFGESTCANITYDNCMWDTCTEAGVRIVNGQSLEHLFLRGKWAFTPRCIDVQGGGRVTVIGGGPYQCPAFLHLGRIGGNARGFDIQSVRFDGRNLRQAWLTVDDTDRAQGYGTIVFSNCSQNDGQQGDTSRPIVTVPPGARVILRDCSFNGSVKDWAAVYSDRFANGELSIQDCDGISSTLFEDLVEAKGDRAYYEWIRCGSIWGPRGSFSTFPGETE